MLIADNFSPNHTHTDDKETRMDWKRNSGMERRKSRGLEKSQQACVEGGSSACMERNSSPILDWSELHKLHNRIAK